MKYLLLYRQKMEIVEHNDLYWKIYFIIDPGRDNTTEVVEANWLKFKRKLDNLHVGGLLVLRDVSSLVRIE